MSGSEEINLSKPEKKPDPSGPGHPVLKTPLSEQKYRKKLNEISYTLETIHRLRLFVKPPRMSPRITIFNSSLLTFRPQVTKPFI
jgi:hypothetical protein